MHEVERAAGRIEHVGMLEPAEELAVAVDDSMIVAIVPLTQPDPSPWGELADTIEAWFEEGDSGAWGEGGDADEPWIVIRSADRPRAWVFDEDDDTDALVDLVLPRA